jgi:hypothetical protein
MRRLKVPTKKVDMQTGETTETVEEFGILPLSDKSVCQVCGVDHDPAIPHNPQSLYYAYTFYAEHQRWPTWRDAMAHCTPEVQTLWSDALIARGVKLDDEPEEKRNTDGN